MCRTIAKLGSCQKHLWVGERWVQRIKKQKSDQTESLVTHLIIHGVYDSCENALSKAKDIARKNSLHTLDFYPLLLLSLRKYQRCYDLLRLRDTCNWIAGSMKNHCPFKNTVGAWTFEINMVKHNNIEEDVSWLGLPLSLSLSSKPSQLLHFVIPVIIVKLQCLRKFRREKSVKFWTFMMGTHPRVGHSCLQQIAGMTPVIQRIFHYTSNDYDPAIDTKMEKIKRQVDKLLSLCQLRRLLVEIAQIPREAVSVSWKCRACKVGGDCSNDPVIISSLGHSWEKYVKHENPLSFVLLQKALKSVISLRGLVTLLNSQNSV